MSIRSAEFIFDSDQPWEPAGQGVQRQIVGHDDRIMMVKVKFETGGVGPMHHHHHSQVTYVVSGRFEMTIGSSKKILGRGDSFYVPSNVEHGCVCLEEGMFIDVFSPAREDFLKN